jgi:NAD(P)-dependent dehydrogenase (short-subunit alcohol dehydrogenase family)
MTGGTSGIGRSALEQLLDTRPEWRIFLLARPSERAAEMEARGGVGNRVQIIAVDLADLASVDAGCAELRRRLHGERIDALGLNAGIQELGGDRVSADGLELSFAVNHLAHFAIADQLMPLMRRGGRVVITASVVHDPSAFCLLGIARAAWQDPLELADPRLSQAQMPAGVERGEARYSASKLLNVMHARALAGEVPSVGVVSFNPGVVPGTEIARERNGLQQFLWRQLLPHLAPLLPGVRSMQRSGSDLLWLLTAADLARISGSYCDGRDPADGSPESRDSAKIARVRAVSHALLEDARARRGRMATERRRAAGA